jgi:diacylglycerol O-acyltransferase / wax synthase
VTRRDLRRAATAAPADVDPASGQRFATMAYSHHERLSALDESFLALEDTTTHMHIGAVALFDAAPLTKPDGGIDIERIRALMEAGLHRIPRYRQRLAWTPVGRHPVWVDDDRFNLSYHLRHTHLPRPGDERALKRLAGRLMSQQLDRGKPLWEMWVVEGVEGGRFAIVTKVHHCMIDGVGSVELTGSVMRPDAGPDPRLDHPAPRWIPRPAPGPLGLVAGELAARARMPVAAVEAAGRVLADPRAALRAAREAVAGLGEAVATGFHPASATPLNVAIGPHRRFDWTAMDLDAVRAVKAQLGGTINDVVLAVVAGALRRFLRQRGVAVEPLDVRAMLPVNVRATAERERLGNRVAMLVARLPLDEGDPRQRLARVVAETRERKGSRQAAGVQALEELSDVTFHGLFVEFARLTATARPFNLIVTNVPGPQFPAYVLGAAMQACYPVVPLYRNQALGIALFSYDGRLFWGFNADWDALPDLHDLVAAVEREFQTLRTLAGDATGPRAAAAG